MSQVHQMTLKQWQRAYGRYNLSVGFYLVQIGPVVNEIWQFFSELKFAYCNLWCQSQMHWLTLKQWQRDCRCYNLSIGFYLVQIRPVIDDIWLMLTKVKFLHILNLNFVTLIKVKRHLTLPRQCPQDNSILL